MDGGTQLFIYDEGVVSIDPYGSEELSFYVNSESDITETQVMLTVWPLHHEYAVKELSFNVTADDSILGDINLDGEVNVLDVVSTINIVLSEEYDASADLNEDNGCDVSDLSDLTTEQYQELDEALQEYFNYSLNGRFI